MKANRPHADAEDHLRSLDPRWSSLIDSVGPCTLYFDSNYSAVLVRSVIAQQISTKAADSIAAKVLKQCGRGGLRPKRINELSDEELQACGLSTSKRKTIRGLTDWSLSETRRLKNLASLSDQEISETLLPLHGIGPWTVQMFLIFAVGRMDILPVGDLGLKMGVKDLYQLPDVPSSEQLLELAQPWQPYRTIGTWYLWRSRGTVPQSE